MQTVAVKKSDYFVHQYAPILLYFESIAADEDSDTNEETTDTP